MTTTTTGHDNTEETAADAAHRLATELEQAHTTIATLKQIAQEAAQVAADIADGKLTNDLGRPPQRTKGPGLAIRFDHDPDCGCTPPCGHGTYQTAPAPPASVPSPARAGSADEVTDIVDAGEVIRRYLDREAPDVSRALFNMDLEGAVMALRDAGWLASPRAQASPVGPSQGQEIPVEQLLALLANHIGHAGECPMWLAEALPGLARAAYRTGFAAALGCPITVSEGGDGLEIGDRPETAGSDPATAEDQGDDVPPLTDLPPVGTSTWGNAGSES